MNTLRVFGRTRHSGGGGRDSLDSRASDRSEVGEAVIESSQAFCSGLKNVTSQVKFRLKVKIVYFRLIGH